MAKTIDIVDEATLLLAFPACRIIVNTDDNHYKFYTYIIEGNDVIFKYGMIGKNVRSSPTECTSPRDANDTGLHQLAEKIRTRGYRPLNFEISELNKWSGYFR